MNRQLRRANEKSDKRREREQERRKEQRRENRVRVVQARKGAAPGDAKDPPKDDRPAPGMRRPGLAGAYLLLVVGVIAAQALVPQQTDTFSLVIHTLFYVILGYFLCVWLLRRGVTRAPVITVVGGLLLAFGVEGLKLVLPQLGPSEAGVTGPNLIFAYLALPGLLLGTWLGRSLFRRSR